MSASHIILDHFCAQNCQIWWKFDVVITKIILLVFLRHGVYVIFLLYLIIIVETVMNEFCGRKT